MRIQPRPTRAPPGHRRRSWETRLGGDDCRRGPGNPPAGARASSAWGSISGRELRPAPGSAKCGQRRNGLDARRVLRRPAGPATKVVESHGRARPRAQLGSAGAAAALRSGTGAASGGPRATTFGRARPNRACGAAAPSGTAREAAASQVALPVQRQGEGCGGSTAHVLVPHRHLHRPGDRISSSSYPRSPHRPKRVVGCSGRRARRSPTRLRRTRPAQRGQHPLLEQAPAGVGHLHVHEPLGRQEAGDGLQERPRLGHVLEDVPAATTSQPPLLALGDLVENSCAPRPSCSLAMRCRAGELDPATSQPRVRAGAAACQVAAPVERRPRPAGGARSGRALR